MFDGKVKVFLLIAVFLLAVLGRVEFSFAQTLPQSMDAQIPSRQYGRASFNAERGMTITLGNRTTGRITVKGWDRDVIEARAISERGDEVVIAFLSDNRAGKKLFLKADYADLSQPSAITTPIDDPPQANGSNLKVDFEVNLPRYIELNPIRVWRSDVEVTGINTAVMVLGERSSVVLRRVGSVEVSTKSGNVEVELVNGPVTITTTKGAVRVHKAEGDVRVISINGAIEIKCVRGRVEVANTQAPIDLQNINGDVKAAATNSSVRLKSSPFGNWTYDLKSMSGRVEMILPDNIHGFEANLSSYQGVVESDFKLKPTSPRKVPAPPKQPPSVPATQETATAVPSTVEGSTGHRLIGRFGDGKTQISLDSFDGLVRLTKVPPSAMEGCN